MKKSGIEEESVEVDSALLCLLLFSALLCYSLKYNGWHNSGRGPWLQGSFNLVRNHLRLGED